MKAELKKAFMSGVDGANANLFYPIRKNIFLSLISKGFRKNTITIEELYKILCLTEDKQDKAIDKYINSDN